ncbi:MAG: Na+/Ca+ antiporter, CaCA family [Candidatus Saccharibacteria bacterium]|jgi:uncharacterized protein (TIGR02611 family)|nr:Na+/Ca+ antiporter, CaCA family [Candidatus Saccharibacteria bacterium]
MDEKPKRPRSALAKTAITVAGSAVTLAGVVLLVTPGPGLVVIAAGLAILASEYVWARDLLHKVRQRIDAAVAKAREKTRRS